LTATLIDACRAGKPPAVGSLAGRKNSGPASGLTSLTQLPSAGDD
jgi:hypothetical protein